MSREPWREVVAAEMVYYEKRQKMFDAGAEQQLRIALSDPTGVATALRILGDAPVELAMSLFDLVFDRAVRTHGPVAAARQVMARLDSGWLFLALRPLVAARLRDPSADWEDYRRVAEVLEQLDQLSILEEVVAIALRSTDPDVREVAEDYRRR